MRGAMLLSAAPAAAPPQGAYAHPHHMHLLQTCLGVGLLGHHKNVLSTCADRNKKAASLRGVDSLMCIVKRRYVLEKAESC